MAAMTRGSCLSMGARSSSGIAVPSWKVSNVVGSPPWVSGDRTRAPREEQEPVEPGFYEKTGYEVYGTLDDYPIGETMFFFRKTIATAK